MKIETITAVSAIIPQVAPFYAGVYAEEPWNEVSQCKRDGFSGEPVGSTCRTCNEVRTEAYPLAETIDYIRGELSLPQALGTLGILDGIVSFSWGYVGSANKIGRTKWKTEAMHRRVTNRILTTNQLDSVDDPVFYLSEVGVRKDARGKGIASEAVQYTLDNTPTDLPWVVRTLDSSPMAYILNKFGFVRVIGPDLPNKDLERPDRVLYVGRSKPSKLRRMT